MQHEKQYNHYISKCLFRVKNYNHFKSKFDTQAGNKKMCLWNNFKSFSLYYTWHHFDLVIYLKTERNLPNMTAFLLRESLNVTNNLMAEMWLPSTQ